MSVLRAHPRRAIAAVLLVALVVIAVIVVSVSRSGGTSSGPSDTDRASARAALAMQSPGIYTPKPSALQIENAARYEWALAQISDEARNEGVPAPKPDEVKYNIASFAQSCCGGSIPSLVDRIRSTGGAKSDLERAIALRIDYGHLVLARARKIPPSGPAAIAKEISANHGTYAYEPSYRRVTLFMCTTLECAQRVAKWLDEGRSQPQISSEMRTLSSSNGVMAGSHVGPAGNRDLWLSVRELSIGERSGPVRALGAWAIAVPETEVLTNRPLVPRLAKKFADNALRNAIASGRVSDEVNSLMARLR